MCCLEFRLRSLAAEDFPAKKMMKIVYPGEHGSCSSHPLESGHENQINYRDLLCKELLKRRLGSNVIDAVCGFRAGLHFQQMINLYTINS